MSSILVDIDVAISEMQRTLSSLSRISRIELSVDGIGALRDMAYSHTRLHAVTGRSAYSYRGIPVTARVDLKAHEYALVIEAAQQ